MSRSKVADPEKVFVNKLYDKSTLLSSILIELDSSIPKSEILTEKNPSDTVDVEHIDTFSFKSKSIGIGTLLSSTETLIVTENSPAYNVCEYSIRGMEVVTRFSW